MKNAKDYIEETSPNTQRITSLAYWLTAEGMNNPIIAALLRKSIARASDEDFKEAFDGATKAEAALHLERWELCYMGQWGVSELAKAIILSDAGRNEALALRAVSMAQSADELPEVFAPMEGIRWAMARGYLISGSICAWCEADPGIYGHPSNPLSTANAPATKEENKADLSLSGDDMEQTLIDENIGTNINIWDDASLNGDAMDFLTYLKIRGYCWHDIGDRIDTSDRKTLRHFRAKNEGGRRGVIRHEAIEAKNLVEACENLSPQQLAAAVLLANASNLYLNTTTDLPRTKGSPPPIEQGEAEELARRTRDAVKDYASFLPDRQAAALIAAYDTALEAAPDVVKNTTSNTLTTNNWILTIQAEAARYWKELVTLGCSPTRHSIKEDLAKWCRNNNVKTYGEIFPTGDYIYRHVISKKKWKPPTD